MTQIMTVYDSAVLVSFPFTTLNAGKKRPAVIVSRPSFQEAAHDVILAAITSQPHHGPGDFELERWKEAGLLKPSRVRLGKLLTVHEVLVLRTLSTLHPDDWNRARTEFHTVLAD